MKRDQVIETINTLIGKELLTKAEAKDDMANAVQILGVEEVSKIAFGVSCNEEFLKQAADWGAQMCVFHHGLDVRTHKSRFPIYYQNRLRHIFKHDLTIVGFHYALDAHPEIGNNAQIIQKLGARIEDTLFQEWGFVASLNKPRSIKELKLDSQRIFDREVTSFTRDENRIIDMIGVVSGAGKPYAAELEEFISKGVQLFISGESSESTPHKLLEAGINYFVCGHYATETFGVKAMQEKLQASLPQIETQFIDIQNPV